MAQQFRSLDDLSEAIGELEDEIKNKFKNKNGKPPKLLTRPTLHWSHPTLYRPGGRDTSKKDVIKKGIRTKDWFLSEDGTRVLPHDQMGLSFSSHFDNLKAVYKTKKRINPTKAVHVFWVISDSDLPKGMKFEDDRSYPNSGHVFLTVTEEMLITTLRDNLKEVARMLTRIQNGGDFL